MNRYLKDERDRILAAATASKDPTVKQALDKLIFTVSLAHDQEFIDWASTAVFTSGCTITIPATEQSVTYQLTWNDSEMQVFSMPFQTSVFEYGHLYDVDSPMPGVILKKDNFLSD